MLNFIYLFWGFIWVFIGFLITMPINLVLLSFKKTYSIAHFFRKIWACIIFLPIGMRIQVHGKEHLKGLTHFIYVANHSSYIDIPTTTLALPGTLSYMAKIELARVPLFGYFFKTIDIGVRRSSARNAYQAFMSMGNKLEQGLTPLIFPEGTIPAHAPNLGNFKIGAFRLAIEKKVPIVPVTMADNASRFPDQKPLKATPGKMRVFIHRPIYTTNLNLADADALKQQVYAIIENQLKECNII